MSKILIDETTVQQALEALEAGEYYIDDLEAIVYAADDLGTHEDRAKMQAAITALKALAEQLAQQEPFGYFKAEPFGWTDCAETDEGAVALYTTPQPAQRTWVVPESIAKYAAALVAGTHEITSLTIRPKRTWVGLTDDELSGFTQHEMLVVKYVNKVLQEKNT